MFLKGSRSGVTCACTFFFCSGALPPPNLRLFGVPWKASTSIWPVDSDGEGENVLYRAAECGLGKKGKGDRRYL